jgi:hypothetical protein
MHYWVLKVNVVSSVTATSHKGLSQMIKLDMEAAPLLQQKHLNSGKDTVVPVLN